MIKRMCALLAALVMVLCAVSALAENADADPVLLTLNGEEVRESTGLVQSWKNYLLLQVNGEPDEATLQTVNQYALNYASEFIVARQKLAEVGKAYTQEELETEKATAKESWDEVVAQIETEQFGIGEDATDEEKAAARADAEAFIRTNYGYTEEAFLAEVELNMIYTRTAEYASEGLEITDEDVEAYYNSLVEEDKALLESSAASLGAADEGATEADKNKAMATIYEYYTQSGYSLFYTPEGYRGITHILLPVDAELLTAWQQLQARLEEQNSEDEEATDAPEATPAPEATETAETAAEPAADATPAPEPEEPVTQEMVDAAKQAILDSVKDKLDEINAKLAEGVSFEDLVREYGTDPGMQDEDRLANGYPVHAGSIQYDSNFASAAMALQAVGDISEPVISQRGVHLLHYLKDIPGGSVEYTEELKNELKAELTERKVQEAYSNLVAEWMGEAEIVWTEAGESWKLPPEEAEEAADAAE